MSNDGSFDNLDNISKEQIEELNSFRDVNDGRDEWFEEYLPEAVESILRCYRKGHRVCVGQKLEELATEALLAGTTLKMETIEDLKELFPN